MSAPSELELRPPCLHACHKQAGPGSFLFLSSESRFAVLLPSAAETHSCVCLRGRDRTCCCCLRNHYRSTDQRSVSEIVVSLPHCAERIAIDKTLNSAQGR